MQKRNPDSPTKKKRYPFLPTLLFVITFYLVQLYQYNLTAFFIVLGLLGSIPLSWYGWKQLRIAEQRISSAREIEGMNHHQFKLLLIPLFQKQGYSVTRIKHSNDQGVHLIVRKRGTKAIVHAKLSQTEVQAKVVRELNHLKGQYKANQVIVVTNHQFTKEAQQYATASKTILMGYDTLDAMIQVFMKKKKHHRFIERVRSAWLD
ncbi:restriction endonuclease [Alkalihalophilus lindianensis]|uniref:Restriction endonuclease n=1 Tax=Alkalihalophilus lindianensis TaxID=1630542 RepID=A0ABU3XEL8_9BACI|nr:restriction endonuclease [Alkalihalophilus lindianensis]MDV2686333.1 restriction endonuclease [Alkalihalophilus lindianensis]